MNRIRYSAFSILFLLALISHPFVAKCQEDLLKLVDSAKGPQKVLPTWKDVKLINVETTKTIDPGVMQFVILHRFGNVGGQGNGGFHTLAGFDVASDIQFAFNFGITKNFMVGISRSKEQELIDLNAKYKLITQNSITPISLAVYGDAGITPELNSTFYGGTDSTTSRSVLDKLSYFGEAIVDRRFNERISLELLGGVQHRNYVLTSTNLTNGATDMNTIPFAAVGGRFMFNKHSSLVADYYYIFSQYRMNNTANPYYMPLSIGYEVETGGHVFEVNFSNAAFLDENNLIPNTHETWTKGGFKLGFSISRVFNI
ncbi:MAG TPA: DUF5777 family beta-barrel protein [Bacteroidia bacterium]|jgi:hypothetical protein|nr:DUF5777 family beta-barrel protein [Bacteroidia bacterium]